MSDQTPFGSLTTVGPVARIVKISVDDHAHIFFEPSDYGKLKKGDFIYISDMNRDQGRGLYNDQTFQLGSPHEDEFQYTLLRDGAEIENESPFVVTGGFARVTGWEEIVPPPVQPLRKAVQTPAKAKKEEEETDARHRR
jgi:hypothetical protein